MRLSKTEHCKLNISIPCQFPMLVGDGFCNDITNNPECYYDGGGCCGNHNNGWVPNVVDCKFCECKAPYGFVYNRQKVKTLFGRNTCFSSLSSIGDGFVRIDLILLIATLMGAIVVEAMLISTFVKSVNALEQVLKILNLEIMLVNLFNS